MTKRKLKLTILAVGIVGALIAFVATPRVAVNLRGEKTSVRCSNETPRCAPDTTNAALRGLGVIVLTAVAFGGVSLTFADKGEDDPLVVRGAGQ